MSIMQLHEDNVNSSYVQFNIVELNIETFISLSGVVHQCDTSTPSIGKRITLAAKNINNLASCLTSEYPHTALDNDSIIKNKNVWENVQGIYTRTDTEMQQIQSGTRPADWDESTHYYTQVINTPTTQQPKQYVTYRHETDYSSAKQYYKDISQPDKRMCRTFFSDAGLCFSVFSGASPNFDNTRRYYKFNNFCVQSGDKTSGYWKVKNYWTLNGNLYNPYTDRYNITSASSFAIGEMWASSIGAAEPSITPRVDFANDWTRLETIAPYAMCFVHCKYNNDDYYGVMYLAFSRDASDATPTYILAGLFTIEYWGTSVIAGGTTPSGQWGPVSEQSGGSGTWNNTDDSASINVPLPVASLPNALTVGGLHAYLMSEHMLDKLSGLMYNPTTFNNFWSKWLNQKFNPISGIISIHKLPFALQPTGTETFVRIAGAVLDATYMSDLGECLGDLIRSQYTETPEYAVSLPEYFGSFYDYDPYTKCYLHLPACGIIKISANEILAGSVSVKYRCDIITGNVCAIVKTTDRNNVVKTQFVTGNCAYKMPFIGRDDGGVDNLGSLISGGISLLSGNVAGAIGAGKAIAEREHSTTITGDCTGNLTPLSDLKLWLEVVRVVPSTPENKQEMQGIPANVYKMLYSISGTGYAEIETIHLENIPDATQDEIAEIENILKNGAVF